MIDRTKRLLAVEATLSVESDQALANFVRANPNWQGAHWADALDVLDDTDSHLGTIEDTWEVLEEARRTEVLESGLVSMVVITLLWANALGTPIAPMDVEGKVLAVLGALEAQA